jgi:glycerol-3-phosphate acyltransferase PlsY
MAGVGLTLVVASYFLGCANGAYYLARWLHGQDIRALGSGNAGARNAGRLYGVGAFATVLAFDAGKGAVAVAVGSIAGTSFAAACALAVVAGHIWPVQLRGRGGKGLAAALGSVCVLDPRLLLAISIAGVALLLLRQRAAVAAIAGLWCAVPVAMAIDAAPVAMAVAALAALLTATHRSNLLEDSRA